MDKVFIKTFGCTQNVSDSEIIMGLLKKAGFSIVKNLPEADLVIVNSCAVKSPTENAVLKYLDSLSKDGKKVVVAGCLPQANPKVLDGFSIIGPSQIHSIVEVVEETLQGNAVALLVEERTQKLALPRIRKDDSIEIIPISSGCLGHCTYCVVRIARGALLSYPKAAIIDRARKAVSEGVTQIWLTSQDTGCYGRDKDDGYLLPELLKDICAIPGMFRVRLGMLNPDAILLFQDRLIEAFKDQKLFRFLHIPVQSGNDRVLKDMRRGYTRSEFVSIISAFRRAYPEMTISTDIICGFPGETKDQFNDTISLLRETTPDIINRSRFWRRPGTEADSLPDQVDQMDMKDRSRFLSGEIERISYGQNKRWLGWKGRVIVESVGKEGTVIARNQSYRHIVIQGEYKVGTWLDVRVTQAAIYHLVAEVLP